MLAHRGALWQGSARLVAPFWADSRIRACCRSSVVEHSIGNGEVDSSILSGSTIHLIDNTAIYVIDFAIPLCRGSTGTIASPRAGYFAASGRPFNRRFAPLMGANGPPRMTANRSWPDNASKGASSRSMTYAHLPSSLSPTFLIACRSPPSAISVGSRGDVAGGARQARSTCHGGLSRCGPVPVSINSARAPSARPIRRYNAPFTSGSLGQRGFSMKATKFTSRLSKVAALALAVGVTSLMHVPLARAASDCSTSVTLADWGENSTGYIDIASGGICLFTIRMRGTVSSSQISQKPAHGKLKKLSISTYEYSAKARYKGSDTFAIKATGQESTISGTSVITMRATIK